MTVPTLLARYPFFDEASEAVENEADSFKDLISEGVLERAEERVKLAITDKNVGEIASPPKVELFSYPVARAIVSVIDEYRLIQRYAWAESVTAFERFKDDIKNEGQSFASVGKSRVNFGDLIQEFGFEMRPIAREGGSTRNTGETQGIQQRQQGIDTYEMKLRDFLGLASGMSHEKWKLVNRSVDEGWVKVSKDEVLELSREAVRQRVSESLPFDVPEEIEALISDEVESVRDALSDTALTEDIDVVKEDEFPPCMKVLLREIRQGEHLEHHSRFAITAFLSNIGMTTDEIVDTYQVNPGFGEEMTRYQTNHIKGKTSPIEYSCPSCATMVTYGDCRNRDDLCDTINHPLQYYKKRLKRSNGDQDDEE